jgi:hypothetical protein
VVGSLVVDNGFVLRSWVLGAAVLLVVGLGGVAAVMAGASVGKSPVWWIETVQSNSGFAGDAQVAVAHSGRTVLAWDAGDPGAVCFGAVERLPCGSPSRLRIEAALGKLPGQVHKPMLLAALGANVRSSLFVAMAGDGTAYVAWQDDEQGDWVVAQARSSRFSRPRPLGVPAGVQLQGLAGAGGGRVAAVWLQYDVRSAPAFRYALLRGDGSIGRTVTIGHPGSPLQSVAFAINDKNEVAASWVNGGEHSKPPRVSGVLCATAGRCSRRQTIHFRHPTGQSVTLTSSLSDGGSATVLVSGLTVGSPTPSSRSVFGLQAAVSRPGSPFRGGPRISPTAEHQVSSSLGANGAVALFNVGGAPATTLAWSHLTARGFTAPQVLDHHASGPGMLALGNPQGDLALAWTDAPQGAVTDTSYSIHASLGNAKTMSPPQTIAPNADHVSSGRFVGGIDARGDAIVVWSEFLDSQSRGVFASIGQS